MIRLIKNEIIKVFKKKSIYIMFALILAVMIFVSCMNKFFTNNIYDPTKNIANYEEYLHELDVNDIKQKEEYINIKTQVDSLKLQKNYEVSSWQRIAIQEYIQEGMYELNTLEYGVNTEGTLLEEEKSKLNEKINKLDTGDWKYFVKEELKEVKNNISQQENLLKDATTMEKPKIEERIGEFKIEKQILEWRIEKDIKFGYDYMNNAINLYNHLGGIINDYEKRNDLNHLEKLEYQKYKPMVEIAKYDLENGTEKGRSDNAIGEFSRVFSNLGIFVAVIAVMVAGSIMSDEFNKGTIKLLLVRPYNRSKILLAKFLTCVIILILSFIVVGGMQFIVSGVVHGFGSYSGGTLVYDFNTNTLNEVRIIFSFSYGSCNYFSNVYWTCNTCFYVRNSIHQ